MFKKGNNFFLIFMLFAFFIIFNNVSFAVNGRYTAKVIIRVLPYEDIDPFTLEPPLLNKDIQDQFRRSMAKLVKQPNALQDFLRRDKVRETEWFRKLTSNNDVDKDNNIQKAIFDLQQNLKVIAEEDTDFIVFSMTSDTQKEELCLLANEMADVFIKLQNIIKESEIRQKRHNVFEINNSIHQELDAIEKGIQNIFSTTGFTDFEEGNFPNPVRVRLNRLQTDRDDCVIQIKQLEAEIEILEKEGNNPDTDKIELKNFRKRLTIQQRKLEQIDKMYKEAEEAKKKFDLAQYQYKKLLVMRDEINQAVKKIDMLIEKLDLKIKDKQLSRLQIVEEASVTMNSDSPVENK